MQESVEGAFGKMPHGPTHLRSDFLLPILDGRLHFTLFTFFRERRHVETNYSCGNEKYRLDSYDSQHLMRGSTPYSAWIHYAQDGPRCDSSETMKE